MKKRIMITGALAAAVLLGSASVMAAGISDGAAAGGESQPGVFYCHGGGHHGNHSNYGTACSDGQGYWDENGNWVCTGHHGSHHGGWYC